jgi:T3SS negative regulator,GrlR
MGESVDALWSVEFSTRQGNYGGGMAVFAMDRIFGGDSQYYYLGTYRAVGGEITGEVEVVHYAGPSSHVFGPLQQGRVSISGQYSRSVMALSGHLIEDPSQKIAISLTRRAELP